MSINNAHFIALKQDAHIIPYVNIEIVGHNENDEPIYKDAQVVTGIRLFDYKFHDADYVSLRRLWHLEFKNVPFDYNAFFKVDPVFMLIFDAFAKHAEANRQCIEQHQKLGYNVYLYLA